MKVLSQRVNEALENINDRINTYKTLALNKDNQNTLEKEERIKEIKNNVIGE